MFLTEGEDLISLNTPINKISAKSSTSLIFAIERAVCGRPQPGRESMMPVLSFSLLFKPLELFPCVGKHPKKAVCFIFVIYFANIYLNIIY